MVVRKGSPAACVIIGCDMDDGLSRSFPILVEVVVVVPSWSSSYEADEQQDGC